MKHVVVRYVNVVADSVMLQYTYEMNLITNFKITHKFFMLPQDVPPPYPTIKFPGAHLVHNSKA
jgi:hypothetical protein